MFCYFSFKSRHIIVWQPAVFDMHGMHDAAACMSKDLPTTVYIRRTKLTHLSSFSIYTSALFGSSLLRIIIHKLLLTAVRS